MGTHDVDGVPSHRYLQSGRQLVSYMPCYRAFQRAQAERSQRPPPLGLCKLREVKGDLLRKAYALDLISADLTAGGRGPYVRSFITCTSDDRPKWLKDVPRQLSELLGYDVLPAIEGLVNDGLSPVQVQQYAGPARTRASGLITECDAVAGLIGHSIQPEYRATRAGNSLVRGLVDSAIALVDDALAWAHTAGAK